MTDTADNVVISASINNSQFQDRCRLRFMAAAISAAQEVLSIATSGPTAVGTATLLFASSAGVAVGMGVTSLFLPSCIPTGAIVETLTGTSVTMNVKVVGGTGVLTGDIMQISAISHVQRVAFAGAIFRGSVDIEMLCMIVLSDPTCRAACLADPTTPGGQITDAQMDSRIASVFTGIATSNSW